MSCHWNLWRHADLKKRETWPSSLSQMNALFLLLLSSPTYEVLTFQISYSLSAICLSAGALPRCEPPHPRCLSPLQHGEGRPVPGWRFLPLCPVDTFRRCQRAAASTAWLRSPWACLGPKHKPRSGTNCPVRPFAFVRRRTGLTVNGVRGKKKSLWSYMKICRLLQCPTLKQ